MRDSGPGTTTPRFRHSAFLYGSESAYTGFLLPFLCEGLERGEAVAVAAGDEHIDALRAALGRDAAAVRFLPAGDWYVRPVRTLSGWARTLSAAARAGRPAARLVNEIAFGDEPRSWVRAEAATNAALADLNGHLLCPYDRRHLPPHLIDAARRTHHLLHDDGWHISDDYVPPDLLLADLAEPLYPADGPPTVEVAVGDTVADLRAWLRDRATAEGWLPPERVEILLLALSELATNGIRHGGRQRNVRVWVRPEAVVCEVTDDGAEPPDPLAGYRPPAPGVIGGMGLWLVHQVCDAFAVHGRDGVTLARFALLR
ncbi:anti-sigma factor RsbA family regulatory protein [Jidongwangia harbinensis]|uniref:anti-sigma factor RsbA family regulatory protein n=1 Tax=Jidongwangia harbinensis TaxID=2878561 RepID=UPI001CDA29A9|nr:anti-sigma factor RsbA family regulatory protein [Jidongwangia harbinensis]MCA2213396.1 sensor histidine kinase [Jidongwangia harbinensis]